MTALQDKHNKPKRRRYPMKPLAAFTLCIIIILSAMFVIINFIPFDIAEPVIQNTAATFVILKYLWA